MQPHPSPRPRQTCTREDALAIVRRLHEAGHVAYFAGGCVRDLLMGLESKDYDVATDAPPDRVREVFINTQAVGAAFGVILVRLGRSVVEVATFRSDGDYLDGRRPSTIRFATAEEDARRRDFTINGLFFDPILEQVHDYVGGQADLKSKTLRAIGEPSHRFDEDYLRLLRAIRFSARFGLQIEPATASAIRSHAPLLKGISPERVAEELRLMLEPPSRDGAWRMLWEFGLIHEIFRFMPEGADPPRKLEGRTLFHNLARGKSVPFSLALAAGVLCYRLQPPASDADLLQQLGSRELSSGSKAVRQALRISNEELEQMRGTLRGLEPLLVDAAPTLAMKKRFLAQPTAPLSRLLMDALAESQYRRERIEQLRAELEELQRTDYAPLPFVTGDDLMGAGLRPSPLFRRVLDQVYDAQLEGRVAERTDAVKLALKLAQSDAGEDADADPPGPA